MRVNWKRLFKIAAAALVTGTAGSIAIAKQPALRHDVTVAVDKTKSLINEMAIRHERRMLVDTARKDGFGNPRSVPVDIYMNFFKQAKAEMGGDKLPVVVINHGNTVPNTKYSYLAHALANDGKLVISIQNDIEGDPKLSSQGTLYVGRLGSYETGAANIRYALESIKTNIPYANYDDLSIIGHSQGGDIAVFYATQNPDTVKTVVTLDNLRFPLPLWPEKMLAIRGTDEAPFKTNANVVPCPGDDPERDDPFIKEDVTKPMFPDCVPPGTKSYKVGNLTVYMSGIYHNHFTDNGGADEKKQTSETVIGFLNDGRKIAVRHSHLPAWQKWFRPGASPM